MSRTPFLSRGPAEEPAAQPFGSGDTERPTDRGAAGRRVLALLPVLLLAAAVRLLGLGNQDLWGDEAFSVMSALGTLHSLFASLASAEPHPPLYPLVLYGWLRAFGHSEFSARLPSAIAGIASVPVGAMLARAFAPTDDERAATVAAVVGGLLVALNPFQVWYSQEARMYAQVSFFAGLSTLCLLRLWQGKRGSVPAYALAVVGAAGSHYFGLFVPLAHGFAVLAATRGTGWWRDPRCRRWLFGASLAGVLYLPWVVVAAQIFTHYYGAQPGTVDLFEVALSSWVRVAVGWSASWPFALAGAAVVTGLMAIGALVPVRSPLDRFARLVTGSWLLTPFVVAFLISLARPMYAERYLVVSSLPFILFMSRGIAWFLRGVGGSRSSIVPGFRRSSEPRPFKTGISFPASPDPLVPSALGTGDRRGVFSPVPSRLLPLIGAGLLVTALVVALGPLYNVWIGRYIKSTYNTHMRDVAALIQPGDAVILDGTSQTPLYFYYVPKPWPMYPLPRKLPLDRAATDAELQQIAQRHTGAWVFLYATPDYDPGYLIPKWLTANAYRVFDNWAITGRLQYYRFAEPAAMTVHPTALRFGQSFLLQQYADLPEAIQAGGSVPVALRWQRLGQAMTRPRVALRLVDPSGFTWAETDQYIGGDFATPGPWVAGQVFEDRHGLLVPAGTPPGDYQLLLQVYGPEAPLGLPVTGSGATHEPGGVVLMTVHVARAAKSLWTAGIAGYQAIGARFGAVTLLGGAGSRSVTAGQSGYLTLYWQATSDHPAVSQVQLSLVGSAGQVTEQRELPLATSGYPPDRWQVGDVLREQYRLPVGDRLPAGSYRITVRPVGPGGPVGAPVDLGSLAVAAGPTPVPAQTPTHPLSDTLGNAVGLSGFDLASTQVRPGATVNLTLHWQSLQPLDTDDTVFVHVLNAQSKVVAQRDSPPQGGQRPTSSWFPGDQILDAYQLTLPANLPPGDYPIEVGMYNPSNGQRLPVEQAGKPAGDRVIVATLRVEN